MYVLKNSPTLNQNIYEKIYRFLLRIFLRNQKMGPGITDIFLQLFFFVCFLFFVFSVSFMLQFGGRNGFLFSLLILSYRSLCSWGLILLLLYDFFCKNFFICYINTYIIEFFLVLAAEEFSLCNNKTELLKQSKDFGEILEGVTLFFNFFLSFDFLGPYPWHMEVPRLGV